MMVSSLLVTVDSLDGLDGLDGLDDGFEVGFAGPPRRGFLEALPDVVAFMVLDGWTVFLYTGLEMSMGPWVSTYLVSWLCLRWCCV
jgi:hypothetical protein